MCETIFKKLRKDFTLLNCSIFYDFLILSTKFHFTLSPVLPSSLSLSSFACITCLTVLSALLSFSFSCPLSPVLPLCRPPSPPLACHPLHASLSCLLSSLSPILPPPSPVLPAISPVSCALTLWSSPPLFLYLSLSHSKLKKIEQNLSAPIAQLVKACM